MPVTNKAAGEPLTTKSEVLETGAALTQVCTWSTPALHMYVCFGL